MFDPAVPALVPIVQGVLSRNACTGSHCERKCLTGVPALVSIAQELDPGVPALVLIVTGSV